MRIFFIFHGVRKAKLIVFADYAKYNYIAHKESSACFVTPSIKKATDSCEVNKYIYENSVNTAYETEAVERYIRSLSSYYLVCSSNGEDREELKKVRLMIGGLSKKCKKINRNMRIKACLIYHTPILYKLIYSIYDRVRKPNWEV